MSIQTPTIEDEVKDVKMKRPHVFILGAGASLAAFPRGDRNGFELPLMKNLVEVLRLDSLFKNHNIDYEGKNFEVIYAQLYSDPKYVDLTKELESVIHSYFLKMQLPDVPTIYDHLVLSLREKDLIASFNWDPLLWQACVRNHQHVKLPHIVFLHGNVAVGYCKEHKIKGPVTGLCRICEKPYTPTKLLYPIEKKNYNHDPYLSAAWKDLRNYLKDAYMLTIFGYRAPESDVEAIEIMKEAWGRVEDRYLEEVEVINTKEEDELRETWSPFIHTHHYMTYKGFYDSWVANHPRRSCDAMWNQLMEIKFLENNSIPKEYDFEGLLKWYQPLIEAEESAKQA